MQSALYWFAAAVVLSVGLWVVVPDRSPLRVAWGLLALWGAVRTSTLLPEVWRPADALIDSTAIALIELAAQGRVGISFRSEDGGESQVSVMEPGDFFGEASLLTGETRSASAIAMTHVDCYRLHKSGLHGFIQRLSDLAEDMSVVLAHREMELDVARERLDREAALHREGETQNELLSRIRRFFSE